MVTNRWVRWTALAAALGTSLACFHSDDGRDRVRLVVIRVTPAAASLRTGESLPFRATGLYSDGSSVDLTDWCAWSSSDHRVATVSDAGLATGVAAGDAQVVCTVDSVTDSARLTVESRSELIEVSVMPRNANICIGNVASFTATAIRDDGVREDVTTTATWTSADESIALASEGTATGVAMGTTTIAASFAGITSNGTTVVVDSCDCLESIQITPATATITIGGTQQFLALGSFSDGSVRDLTADVTWSSSDTAVATIDAAGLATGIATGETTITAELDGSISNDATLTLAGDDPVGIFLDPVVATLRAGTDETVAIRAISLFGFGSTMDVTEVATWSSSDETMATVSNAPDSRGLVTPNAVSDGVVEITASVWGFTAEPALVTVLPCDFVVGLEVLPMVFTITSCCGPQTMTATATYCDGHLEDVTARVEWSSSDPSIATVDAAGLVTAVNPGTTEVRATLGTVSGVAIATVVGGVATGVAPGTTTITATVATLSGTASLLVEP
jgi:uncharacterized protein YjdB